MNTYCLNNGLEIPVLGFGTWKASDGKEAYEAVLAALKAGTAILIQLLIIRMKKVLVGRFKIVVFRVKNYL